MKRASLPLQVTGLFLAATLLLSTTGCRDEKARARERLRQHGIAMTPAELIRASGGDKPEIVRLFVQSGYDLNVSNFNDGRTPLTSAVASGNAEIVDLLLEGGADINQPGPYGNTALMLAIDAQNSGIVKALLERGANASLRNSDEFRALELAAYRNSPELVRMLTRKCPEQLNRALHVACMVGEPATVEALLEGGADVNATMMPGARTPLMVAAEHGKVEVAKVFLAKHADITPRDQDGKTALMLAIENRYQDLEDLLQQAQRNPDYLAAMASAEKAPRILPREMEMGQGDGPDPDELAAAPDSIVNPPLPSPTEMPTETVAPESGERKPLLDKFRDRLAIHGETPAQPAADTPSSLPAAMLAEAAAEPPAEFADEEAGASTAGRFVTADGVVSPEADAGGLSAPEDRGERLPLRLSSVHREVLPIRYTGGAGGSALVEVGGQGGKVHRVKKGQEIPGMGYRVTGISARRSQDKFGDWLDASTLYLEDTRSGEQLTLVKNLETESPSSGATLTLSESGNVLEVTRGQRFELPNQPGREFVLEDVRPDQVVVQEVGTGNMYTVGR